MVGIAHDTQASIDCDGAEHRSMLVFARAMILVYPVGVPAALALLLWLVRHQMRHIKGGDTRDLDAHSIARDAAEIGEAFEETARRSAEERIAADPSFVPSSHLTENTLERAMGLRV